MIMLSQKIYIVVVLIVALVSGSIFFFIGRASKSGAVLQAQIGKTVCEYKLINPNRCEPETREQKREYLNLRKDLITLIDEEEQKGKAKKVAVFFRDLQNGPIVNISGDESFSPASLLKVPLMIAYFKKAEEDPVLLQKNLRIVGDIDVVKQNITPQEKVEKGKEYTIDEIIRIMITQSDNVSWEVLLRYMRQEYSEEEFTVTLSDLGIIDPRKRNVEQIIPVQTYASLFRILYNSSYLLPEMSDKALGLLSQSAFRDGIVVGVPKDVRVAHKFGEVKYGTEQQLHDCGIVYHPKTPYLLCVMTKGDSIAELEPVIQNISKVVYEAVNKRNDE